MKKSRIVLLCLLVILAVAIVALLSLHFKMRAFVYENTWRFCPDFNTYEKEFTLVKDYVEDYMCGNTGSLIVSNRKDHGYDLYDTETDSYINCPDEVKCAIREIAQKAFYHKDATFDSIYVYEDEIAFTISNGPYQLVYNPKHPPTKISSIYEGEILVRKIKDGWYHVTLQS